MAVNLSPRRRDPLVLATLHAVVALYLWLGRGVTIAHDYGPDPWSWFWQNVPTDLLRDRAMESLWWLHAQPPLWNALGAALIKLFGDLHLPALQAFNIVLGAGIVALVHILVRRHTGSRRWSMAAAAVMALHPALFLYEAYALYTVLVAFLVLTGAFFLDARRDREGWGPLLGFVAVVSILVLTRSLFHLVLLAVAVPLVIFLKGRPSLRPALVLTVLVLAPSAWYGKNQVQHGFFGASSWYGMGLWRTALFNQDPQLLNRALEEGDLSPVVRLAPFTPPSAYVPLGFNAGTSIPLLGRDDLHNVNIPAISHEYQRSARALIVRAPGRYLANVFMGYRNFTAPSTGFRHLDPNRERMGLLGQLDQWVLLRPIIEAGETRLGGGYWGSLYFLLIPGILLAYVVVLARAEPGGWRARLRRDATMAALAGVVLYATAVGCAMELGENVRFKFLVEPAFLVLMVVTLHRLRKPKREEGGTATPLS